MAWCLCASLIVGSFGATCRAADNTDEHSKAASTQQRSRALLKAIRSGETSIRDAADASRNPAPRIVRRTSVEMDMVEIPEAKIVPVNGVASDVAGIVAIPAHERFTPLPLPSAAEVAMGATAEVPSTTASYPGSHEANAKRNHRHQSNAARAGAKPVHRANRISRFFGFSAPAVLKQGASKVTKPFVEFHDDPEFNASDYKMPIVMVAAEEEIDDQAVEANKSSELFSRKLSDIRPTLDYAWGDLKDSQLPDDFHEHMDNGPFVEKTSPQTVVQWEPTNLWYYPLYFEDPALERYGHTRKPWLQPFISTGRFVGQTVGLPYQMTLHPPKCREFALGYYQPGECAPKKKYQIPFNEEATAVEFLWLTGLILLIP